MKKTRISLKQLRLAIELEDLQLCRSLIEQGISSDSGLLEYQDDTKNHFSGQIDTAEHSISSKASVVGTLSKESVTEGYNQFHYAANVGNVQVLHLLFEKAPREILRCCRPLHPIHLAITRGHVECVKLIINQARKGTTISLVLIRVCPLKNPKVEYKCLQGHVCRESYNLQHVPEITVKESGSDWPWRLNSETTFSDQELVDFTPLKIAADLGEVDIARSLIEHGASVDGIDHKADTPLHIAARRGQKDVANLLIRSGASVNARDEDLMTPCMQAARGGNLAVIQELVRGGADITLHDSEGFTALHNAAFPAVYASDSAYSEYLDVIIFLIHEMEDSEIFTETKEGYSILGTASWPYPPYQTFLLNLAPNPSVYEPRQSTNVIAAVVHTNTPINLKRLLRRLPKNLIPTLLAHRSLLWGTPLNAAATLPSENLIDMLLDAGADLELLGGDHGTPLLGACAAGRLDVVKTLVRKGARTSYIEDGERFSALDAVKHYPKVVRWLLVGRFVEGPLLIEDRGEV